MKKRLLILGILVICLTAVLTSILLYNRFNRSKTKTFELSIGDKITYTLKTGTGLDMAADQDGSILFSASGIKDAVTALWYTRDDYYGNLERLEQAGINVTEKEYGKLKTVEFEYAKECVEYYAMIVIPDSDTSILFKSNTEGCIERVLKSSEIHAEK